MQLWFFPALLAFSGLVSMASGIWLLLHLTALAHMFAGKADVVPPRAFPRTPRRTVRRMLTAFLGGTGATLVVLLVVVSGAANAIIA